MTALPCTMEGLDDYDAVLLSDVGANSILDPHPPHQRRHQGAADRYPLVLASSFGLLILGIIAAGRSST